MRGDFMMRKIWIFTLCVILFGLQWGWTQTASVSNTTPKSGDLGLGIMLGSPTGVTGKYWLSTITALDGGLGFPFDSDVRLNFNADYLYHFPIHGNIPGFLPFYIGAGARLRALDKERSNDKADFGIRIPLGLEFIPSGVPLDFFAEIAPAIVVAPRGDVGLDGVVGIRYKFSAGSSK
jgi:hypothetical protein